MLYIPLHQVANQQLTVQLSGQNCQINVYQKFFGLFLDLYVSDSLIIGGVLCQNLNRLVRSAYLGFIGDLGWWDLYGNQDPVYTGIGVRFRLVYLSKTDIDALGVPPYGS